MKRRVVVEWMAMAVHGLNYERMWRFVEPKESEWYKFSISAMALLATSKGSLDERKLLEGFIDDVREKWNETFVADAINEVIDGRSESAEWVNDVDFEMRELKFDQATS